MGPDHPQYEIYTLSKHGVVWETEGDTGVAPSCPDCHMNQKLTGSNGQTYTDHDLSFGIAYGPVGGADSHRSIRRGGQLPYVLNGTVLSQNPAFDPNAAVDMSGADGIADSAFPEDLDGTIVQVADTVAVLTARRAQMVNVCTNCHAESFAEYRLDIADGMHENANIIKHEAEDILRALHYDALLVPSTGEKPQNPDAPAGLTLGGPMVYRNLSEAERLFFKLYKYDFVKTWHGAYHGNPDYAHWYGWAEMNLTFADIADEAYELRYDYALKYAIEHNLPTVWTVPYQGVIWNTGSMTEMSDTLPAGTNMSVDTFGSGVPITYTGITFH